MLKFIQMAESVRQISYGTALPDNDRQLATADDESCENFFKLCEECQPFVFEAVNESPEDLQDKWNVQGVKLDVPFRVFSIELPDRPITSPPDYLDTGVELHCIMVHELRPRFYHFYVYGSIQMENGEVRYRTAKVKNMGGYVKHYLDRLNAEDDGIEYVKEKVKIGSGKKKRTHKIRRVIHVRRGGKKSNGTTRTGRKIVWSHSFAVRGHWVKLTLKGSDDVDTPRIGKDRGGEYNIKGYTWRKAHIKGDGEFIKKIRKVKAA